VIAKGNYHDDSRSSRQPDPFSGCNDSFFGIVHGQGRDAIEFYTEKKVVERWAKEQSRRF